MKKEHIYKIFGNKWFVFKIKYFIRKTLIWNYLYRDNFLYIQIYDKDGNLLWNKKLEWLGHGFRDAD